jgi:hypothetical protein
MVLFDDFDNFDDFDKIVRFLKFSGFLKSYENAQNHDFRHDFRF